VDLTDELRSEMQRLSIPLPAARSAFDPTGPPGPRPPQKILAAEGLAWEALKIKGMRKPFFTRGERAALVVPEALTATAGPR